MKQQTSQNGKDTIIHSLIVTQERRIQKEILVLRMVISTFRFSFVESAVIIPKIRWFFASKTVRNRINTFMSDKVRSIDAKSEMVHCTLRWPII